MRFPLDRRFLLLAGIILLLMVVASALTGETFEANRYHPRFVECSEEPKRFWWNVVLNFLGGLFLIGFYIAHFSN